LKLSLPRVCVATPDLADLLDPDAAHCVLVWDATEREAPPKGLLAWAQARSKADLAGQPPRYFSATYRFFRQKQWRLGLLPVY